MSRLAVPQYVPPARGELEPADDRNQPTLKQPDFLERLAKYVPAETVAFFVAVNIAIIGSYSLPVDGSAPDPAKIDATFWVLAWGTVLVGLVATPLILYRARDTTPTSDGKVPPWKVNVTLGSIAFPIWAYSVGGALFIGTHVFQPLVATVLVGAYTLLAPLVPAKK